MSFFGKIGSYFSGSANPEDTIKAALELRAEETTTTIVHPEGTKPKRAEFLESAASFKILGYPPDLYLHLRLDNLKYDPDLDLDKLVDLPIMKGFTIVEYEEEECQWAFFVKYEGTESDTCYGLEFTDYESKEVVEKFKTTLKEIVRLAKADQIPDLLSFVVVDEPKKVAEKVGWDNEEESKGDVDYADINGLDSLFRTTGTLAKYGDNDFEIVDNEVMFELEKGDDVYFLSFHVSDKLALRTKLLASSKAMIYPRKNYLLWIHEKQNYDMEAYTFTLDDEDQLRIQELGLLISLCLYLIETGENYEEVKEEDLRWVNANYVHDEMDEMSYYDSEMSDDIPDYEMEEVEVPLDDEDDYDGVNQETLLALGYGRAFASKDCDENVVAIYNTEKEGLAKYEGDLKINGKGIHDLKLFDRESKFLFLSDLNENSINVFDFEKGKVVEEWEADGNRKLVSISNFSKNGLREDENLILACTSKGLFTLDPRENSKKKAVLNKIYTADLKFTKMVSTITGHFMVCNEKGEIRLYDLMGKRAKTLLPGLGLEIIGADTTLNGHWILATCKDYILVIPTKCSNGKSGFEYLMGKEKPRPRRLMLRLNDIVRYGLGNCTFSPATFNNGKTRADTEIISSIGKYVVTWKLKDIKKGNLMDYVIKDESKLVVCGLFRFDADEIMVTMPESIKMHKKKFK